MLGDLIAGNPIATREAAACTDKCAPRALSPCRATPEHASDKRVRFLRRVGRHGRATRDDSTKSAARVVRPQLHPQVVLYRSTAWSAYIVHMGFEVHFEDDTTTQVLDADAYEQEGPLTTFFDRNGGGRLASAFALRVASFRTSRIVEIRRVSTGPVARLAS